MFAVMSHRISPLFVDAGCKGCDVQASVQAGEVESICQRQKRVDFICVVVIDWLALAAYS